MKNTIKISRLMDAYTDNEFFIQGESEVNMDTVKNNVIEKAEGAKKRVKPVAKVLIGVAAAAALAVGATAATTVILNGSGRANNASGSVYHYYVRDDGYEIRRTAINHDSVLTMEDGRLYFNINDESTDVTDLMDNQTPYIYAYINTDTGKKNYLVLGGTPEEYYFIDLIYLEGIGWQGDGAMNGIDANWVHFELLPSEDYTYMATHFDKGVVKENDEVHFLEESWQHNHSVSWSNGTGAVFQTDLPENWETDCMDAWLLKALIQLEIIPAL